jgi:GST-like protein
MDSTARKKYTLYTAPYTGGQIIERALKYCRAPYVRINLDYEKTSKGLEPRLKKINPLSRLPTLILPNGTVLTESGAIILHLRQAFPKAGLTPTPGDKNYDLFLRLLFILTGEIYPCFTFMDDPSEWSIDPKSRASYRSAVLKHQKSIWKTFDSLRIKAGPWVLGKTFSALDLYLAEMTYWRPREPWFRKYLPDLAKIAVRAREKIV